ncbi:SMP-30/gluconolactonase/LRE family protein [Spirosoma arcticum]
MRIKRIFLSGLISYLIIAGAAAQELPAIFQGKPVTIVPSALRTSFPKKTFLENIVINGQDELFVTSHYEGVIYKIRKDHGPLPFARIKGKLTGLVFNEVGNLLATAYDENEKAAIYYFDQLGKSKKLLVAKDAQFLNGITELARGYYLIADSYKGCLWLYDERKNALNVWVNNPLLGRTDAKNPTPAVNGVKIFNGYVYASNTQQQRIVRIPLLSNYKAGNPETYIDQVNVDDFVLDKEGNLYGTTHIYNSLIKITPEKKVFIVSEIAQGMAGSTAVAWGRPVTDQKQLYVTTNGGMSYPPRGGVEDAKVVALRIN